MNQSGFYPLTLHTENNLFEELSPSVQFEQIAKGRMANHWVNLEENNIPIVRTTSKYNLPAQKFSDIHFLIINLINQAVIDENITHIPTQKFNNALIEIYDANYTKMSYHSDQSLDLCDESYIGLFSCYEHPDTLTEQNIRKLKIKDKVTSKESEFALNHNTVILFSTHTNLTYHHKIVLENNPKLNTPITENKWLGITFRTSKTYIHFKDNVPYFANGDPLTLANEEQELEFFKLRGQENKSLTFTYPTLSYTINPGDTLLPH